MKNSSSHFIHSQVAITEVKPMTALNGRGVLQVCNLLVRIQWGLRDYGGLLAWYGGRWSSAYKYGDLYMIMYYYVYDDYFVQNRNHKQFSASIQLANRQTAFLWAAAGLMDCTEWWGRPTTKTLQNRRLLWFLFSCRRRRLGFDGNYYHLVNTHLIIGECCRRIDHRPQSPSSVQLRSHVMKGLMGNTSERAAYWL